MKFSHTAAVRRQVTENVTQAFTVNTDGLPAGHFKARVEARLAEPNVSDFFGKNAAKLAKALGTETLALRVSSSTSSAARLTLTPGQPAVIECGRREELSDYLSECFSAIARHCSAKLGVKEDEFTRDTGMPRFVMQLEDCESFAITQALLTSDPDAGLHPAVAAFNRELRERKPVVVDDSFVHESVRRVNAALTRR